jgi:LPXTG-motif cell wall-anchored protein
MLRLVTVFGLLLWFVLASVALAQSQPQIVISSPANGATVSGPDVTVTIQVTGTTLVPAASATKTEDMHVHYLLDVDPTPYLSGTTPIPMGDPNIVHSAALTNTFSGVAPGAHRVTVILGLATHAAVQPPVAPSISFTVAAPAAAPAQLPRTGDASTLVAVLLMAGVITAVLGIALRERARSGLGHRR